MKGLDFSLDLIFAYVFMIGKEIGLGRKMY